MLSSFSSRWNLDSPTPSPAGECLVPGGGAHSLGGEGGLECGESGWGGPNSYEGTYEGTLGMYICTLGAERYSLTAFLASEDFSEIILRI